METLHYLVELHEYAQRTGLKLEYEDLGSVGPCHDKTFTQRVVLDGKAYPEGVGKSKREAKRDAAKNALKCLLENKQQDSTADENSNRTSTDQTEELNVSDICERVRLLGVNSQLNRPKQRQTETNRDKQAQIETKRDKQRQTETNYIGLVDHYCRKKKRWPSYIEERRCGPPHDPRFFYIVMITDDNGRKEYPEAEGKTAKEAKQNAARLAWFALQEQTDWDSKVSVRSTVSRDGATPTLSTPSASLESPSQTMPTITSDSIIITGSSNPSEAQMSFRAAGPEHDAPTGLSTPPSLESLESSQSMSVGTSGSEIFTDSSNSSTDQPAVKVRNVGNRQNEPSNLSRFTTDFEPMGCLGSGAFGCVYKAKHKLLFDKYFAVKIVRCEEKSLREVGTLTDLLHPNIVRYYTFWMEDSGYQWDLSAGSSSSSQSTDNSLAKYLYIQMELCDTKTLTVWIDEKNTQSLEDSKRREESLNIVQQILSGVEYIHSKKHIHRDLKPDNILFGLEGEVKIGDFGLVTKDDEDDSALMERTGDRGTTSYMAPEQKREKTYDRKVDIFSLGLIYFELLWKLSTGHERVKVWDDVRSQKLPEEFSQIFPEEKQIIESMLCEKPEERPEASSLKAELEKWTQTFNAQRMHQETHKEV